MNIALVEDDPDICEMMTCALELAGYSVLSWPDGPSFLGWVAGQQKGNLPLGVLITDWSLQGEKNGGDVIEGLHQEQNGARLPAIIITGTSEEQVHLIGACYPEVPVLRKPFPLQHLLWSIQQIVPHS